MSPLRNENISFFNRNLLLSMLHLPSTKPSPYKTILSSPYLQDIFRNIKNIYLEARPIFFDDGVIRESISLDATIVLYYLFANFSTKNKNTATTKTISFSTLSKQGVVLDIDESYLYTNKLLGDIYTVAHLKTAQDQAVSYSRNGYHCTTSIPFSWTIKDSVAKLQTKSSAIQRKISLRDNQPHLVAISNQETLLSLQKICFEALLFAKMQSLKRNT